MEMDNIIKDCLAALYRLENDALNSRDGYGYSGGDAETIRRAISQNYSLRHKNDELKAENEQLKAKLEDQKWQPIETAPRDGTLIQVYSENGFSWEGWPNDTVDNHVQYLNVRWGHTSVYSSIEETHNGKGDGFILYGSGQDGEYNIYTEVIGATHWMPLPKPPQEKED